MPVAYTEVYYALDVIMEANTMDPDQTALLGAVQSGTKLFAIFAIYEINKTREQTTMSRLVGNS